MLLLESLKMYNVDEHIIRYLNWISEKCTDKP